MSSLLGAACLELSLPDPPGPGAVQGTLVSFTPGRSAAVPAEGAKVVLRNSSLSTVANSEGFFRLEPIDRAEGTLLFTLDLDGDGTLDRQKTLSLQAIGAGRGKQVALGQVTLGRNASIVGKVVRDELGAQRGGHGGTTVLVPEGPYATSTADDGSFLLGELPDGPLLLAFFREGYATVVQEVSLRSGEELSLGETRLTRTDGGTPAANLSGRVVRSDGTPLSGAVVHLAREHVEQTSATTDQDGRYRFAMLSSGLVDIAATKDAFATGMIRNLLVSGETTASDLVLGPGTSTPPMFGGLGGGAAGGGAAGGSAAGGAAGGGDPKAGGSAGGSTAGGSTAGGSTAGGSTAGGSTAGGSAGGAPPLLAVIAPNPVVVDLTPLADGGTIDVIVSGAQSVGNGPLQYAWEVFEADAGLQLEPASSPFDSNAHFTVTNPVVKDYTIRLFVTDVNGVQSDWASATLRASYRPTVTLQPANQLVPTTTQLTCVGNDPGGLSLMYDFRLLSGQASVSHSNEVATVTSSTANVVIIGCDATNAFGLKSAEARATITFDPSMPLLSVDAGPDLTVDAGTVLQLQATISPTGPVTTIWRELGTFAPPLQIVPDTQDPLRATITVPQIAGGNSVRRVSVEVVSAVANCTPPCPRAVDEVSLTVIDRAGPAPVRQPGPGHSRFRSLLVEYDEPVATPPTFVLLKAGGLVSGRTVTESPQRFRFVPDQGLQSGTIYQLQGPALTDLAGNVSAGLDAGFVARNPVTSESTSSLTVLVTGGPVPPAPGVAFLSAGSTMPARVVVAGYRESPDNFFSFSPLPAASANLNGETPHFTNTIIGLPRNDGATRRLFSNGQLATAQLSLAAVDGGAFTDGMILTSQGLAPNDWAPLQQLTMPPPSSPGPIAVDGTTLFSLVRTTAQFGVVTNGAQGWPNYLASTAAMEIVFPNNSGVADGQFLGAFATGASLRSVAFVQSGTQLFVARSPALGPWEVYPASLSTPTKAIRVAHVRSNQKVFVATSQTSGTTPLLRLDSYSGGTLFSAETSPVATAISGFDLVRSELGDHLFLAVASGSNVTLHRRWGNSTAWELVASLGRGGCNVANPELAVTEDDGLFLTWTESCGGGWYVVLARLD